MTIVLLDPRWPEMIPCTAIKLLDDPHTLLVTHIDQKVQQLLANGATLIVAPSLQDPLYIAANIMRTALERGEWEAQQTHRSLVPYLQEETVEFIAAIAAEDDVEMCKELSDILLQVLFHAELASRRNAFDLNDVATAFITKMRNRAPYLFDNSSGVVSVEEQQYLWELGKRQERQKPHTR
ncbi:MazG nucleotide pyrophosphohydrolase domain-containing protein [Corynebacterium caspium]|uniref:MazG nucleotide pyrophosphohydrolase domain-containing protein n=1 Tax=Corynebacterium caspium TaxID=234828 RepID=UPI000476CA6E|nr:MazG nucleotide pyrophosphohydrolase domain-containing protein [Corynebacterium caspium]